MEGFEDMQPSTSWLAGLLEGEGTFSAGAPSLPLPFVQIGMVDADVIEQVRQIFGITYVQQKADPRGYRDIYRVVIRGRRAVDLMHAVFPFMASRRQRQIVAALETHGLPLPSAGSVSKGEQFEWLAGILEAEGTFGAGPPSEPNRIYIRIEMVDYDVVEYVGIWFQRTVTPGRRASEQRQASYLTQVTGRRAVNLMIALRPYMGQRRQAQIDAALASFNTRMNRRQGEYNPSVKLLAHQVLEIYDRVNSGESHRALAREFGVAHPAIGDIKTGHTWGWLTGAGNPEE